MTQPSTHRPPSATTTDALRSALVDLLEAEPALLVLGETAGRPGDLLAGTDDVRVRAMPVADHGTLGVALGAALAGRKVVVELSGPGRLAAVAEVLAEAGAIASKGEFPCTLVVRVPHGAEAVGLDRPVGRTLLDLPGVTVVCGSSPAAAAGLLRWAVGRTSPVVLLEPRALAQDRGAVESEAHAPRTVTHREGGHATVATFGAGVRSALAAADALAAEGLQIAVVELESLHPLDTAGLAAVVRTNGRLVVAHDGEPELARAIRDAVAGEAFWWLESPLLHGATDDVAALVRRAVHA
ncbi:MAG: hypothetical protein H6735_10505 [Alphaproteobacteria bacterium]|nr:hypothetical protein [Alphaproteobacteria bacterium]